MTKLAGGGVVEEGGEHGQEHRLDVVEGGGGLEVGAPDVGVLTLWRRMMVVSGKIVMVTSYLGSGMIIRRGTP